MASFPIDMTSKANYTRDLVALRNGLTNAKGNIRATRADKKTNYHDVTLTTKDGPVTIYIRESDFYFLGFKATNGTVYHFYDKEHPKEFPDNFAKNYKNDKSPVKALGASIEVTYSAKFFGTKLNSGKDVGAAAKGLAAYAGGKFEDTHAYAIVFMLCEALRFKNIQAVIEDLIASNTAVKFADYESIVKSWSAISGGTDAKTMIKNPETDETKPAKDCQDLLAVVKS